MDPNPSLVVGDRILSPALRPRATTTICDYSSLAMYFHKIEHAILPCTQLFLTLVVGKVV